MHLQLAVLAKSLFQWHRK